MAKLSKFAVSTELKVVLELDESEVRALDGIFGYSVDAFLKVFYEKMGKCYVQPYEAGVRSLHTTIRGVLSGPIAAVDEARKKRREMDYDTRESKDTPGLGSVYSGGRGREDGADTRP